MGRGTEPIEARSAAQGATRREFVAHLLGGVGAAALLGACDSDAPADVEGGAGADGAGGARDGASAGGDAAAPGDAARDAASGGVRDTAGDALARDTAGPADADAACTLYPEQTTGPYYLDLDLVRRDVTEGRPGAPLRLELRVLAADGCTPLRDVAVDIWHCDAAGVYSGFPGQLGGLDTTGERFLRGTQLTDDDGRAVFDTIYPGWYPGRTTHIHFRVHPSARTQATSQLYFPEDVTAAVYEQPPYLARGPKDTPNTADGVVRASGLPPLPAMAPAGAGWAATLTVTIAG